jgi:hypothetical protein
MILTAGQQWRVATVYEKAAADEIGVPSPQRAAFARKAKRFRLLARIAAKIETTAFVKPAPALTLGQLVMSHERRAPPVSMRGRRISIACRTARSGEGSAFSIPESA